MRVHVLHPDTFQDSVHTVFNESKFPAREDHASVRSVEMEFRSVIFPILNFFKYMYFYSLYYSVKSLKYNLPERYYRAPSKVLH